MSENIEEALVKTENESEDEIVILKPKVKKVLTEKQREQGRKNLEAGRAKLAEKKKIQKEEADKRKEELILLKAEKIKNDKIKTENKIKQNLNMSNDEPDEVEERIIKKPKKKRIIYKEESDSEEEIIIKTKAKPVKEAKALEVKPLEVKTILRPIFWG
jgi:hypothetical protein